MSRPAFFHAALYFSVICDSTVGMRRATIPFVLCLFLVACGDSSSPSGTSATTKPAGNWYILQGEEQVGPMTASDLTTKVLQGDLAIEVLAWNGEEGSDWKPLVEAIPSLAKEKVEATWAKSLKDYIDWGDPGKLAAHPNDKSDHALWLTSMVRPDVPKPAVAAIIEKARPIIDPLIALDGSWSPVLAVSGRPISARAIRGLGRAIWGDLRYSLVTGDQERVFADLLILANLPRMANESDPSSRGFMTTLGTMGIFGWGVGDILAVNAQKQLTAEQCQRLAEAADWLFEPSPFGADAESNKIAWGRFKSRQLSQLRGSFKQLCP